jgi:hypothetical protein
MKKSPARRSTGKREQQAGDTARVWSAQAGQNGRIGARFVGKVNELTATHL